MKTKPADAFTALYHELKECPTDECKISVELLESAWNDLRSEKVDRTGRPSPAIMAALLLSQEEFRSLINDEDYTLLEMIATEAVNQYLKIINLNNPVGRKLADAIKETQQI